MTATGYVSTTGDARKVAKSGDTMTGDLVLNDSSPDTSLSATSKTYVDTGLAGKASTAHAATHAAAGSDPVTLTQDQITGLAAALAALAPLAGATFTGTVTVSNAAFNVTGYTTLAGGQANGNWAIFGNLSAFGTGKAYRFRTDGSSLDLEATGVDLIVSNWSGTNFDGTQRSYMRFAANALASQWAGKVEFVDALYGTAQHTLDGTGNQVGFFGATPASKPTVTGSRGGNAALASLLTALATLGLITDGTTV
jgi:hypothetical protein